MQLCQISIFAPNRVGLLASVTRSLSHLSGDLQEIRQTGLASQITLSCLVSFPEKISPDIVKAHLEDSCRAYNIQLFIQPVEENSHLHEESRKPRTQRWRLISTGQDQPAMIFSLSSLCAQQSIDIAELYAIRNQDESFIIKMELDIPRKVLIEEFELQLEQWADMLDVSIEFFKTNSENSAVLQSDQESETSTETGTGNLL